MAGGARPLGAAKGMVRGRAAARRRRRVAARRRARRGGGVCAAVSRGHAPEGNDGGGAWQCTATVRAVVSGARDCAPFLFLLVLDLKVRLSL